jgi:hypothetical protein
LDVGNDVEMKQSDWERIDKWVRKYARECPEEEEGQE